MRAGARRRSRLFSPSVGRILQSLLCFLSLDSVGLAIADNKDFTITEDFLRNGIPFCRLMFCYYSTSRTNLDVLSPVPTGTMVMPGKWNLSK